MSSTVTTATLAAVSAAAGTPGLARAWALGVFLVLLGVLLFLELTAPHTRRPTMRRARSGAVLILAPAIVLVLLTSTLSYRAYHGFTPALSAASERAYAAKFGIHPDPDAAVARVTLAELAPVLR